MMLVALDSLLIWWEARSPKTEVASIIRLNITKTAFDFLLVE